MFTIELDVRGCEALEVPDAAKVDPAKRLHQDVQHHLQPCSGHMPCLGVCLHSDSKAIHCC